MEISLVPGLSLTATTLEPDQLDIAVPELEEMPVVHEVRLSEADESTDEEADIASEPWHELDLSEWNEKVLFIFNLLLECTFGSVTLLIKRACTHVYPLTIVDSIAIEECIIMNR
jgi:hypothetical protein